MTKMLEKIFDINMKLASISRYSQTHLVMNESVLEHTGSVCLFCYLIAERISLKVDMAKLLTRAIVHDLDEISTGDIPTITKYANSDIEREIKKVEEQNMLEISATLTASDDMFNTWKNAKDDSIEGAILITADALSVLYKLWQESVFYNNKTLIGHINNIEKSIKEKSDKLGYKYDLEEIYLNAFIILDQIKQANGR